MPSHPILAGLLALAPPLLCLAPPSQAQTLPFGAFQDWAVGCDTTRSCRAVGLPVEVGDRIVALRIDRDGAGPAAPRVSLLLDPDGKPPPRRLEIGTESGPLATLVVGETVTVVDAATGVFALSGSTSATVLAAVRRARELRVRLPDQGADSQPPPISLAGASAALLWMDEHQRRLVTRTALVRTGQRDPASVPAPPRQPTAPPAPAPIPAVAAPGALPAGVEDELRRLLGDTCDDMEMDGAFDAETTRLAPGLLLVSVGCLRGAYNVSRAFHLLEEGPTPRLTPARFPRPTLAIDDPEGHVLTNPQFDAATGEMVHVSKGRGFSDCGEMGAWRWTGREFALTRYEVMPLCRGLTTEWIVLYRAGPAPAR